MPLTQVKGSVIDRGVYVTDYGAIGDGVSDDTAAIQAAIAVGGTVLFPAGTYRVTSFSITPPANTRLVGDGAGISTIEFESATTTSKEDFVTSNGNIEFKGLSLYHNGPASETAQVITLAGDNIVIDGCEIYANDSVSVDTIANAFIFNNSNASRVVIRDTHIHNVNRVILRDSSSTGVVSDVQVTGCRFTDLGEGGVQFNFPNGSITGVRVTNNYFNEFHTGTEQIYTGGASIKNAVFSGNVFEGACKESIHIEEDAQNIVVDGNTFKADGLRCVAIYENNIAGTYSRPTNVVISNNTFETGGAIGTGDGILAVEDGVGDETYDNLVITGNTFQNFDHGMRLGLGAHRVSENIIDNCAIGLRVNTGTPDVTDNVFNDCTLALELLTFYGLLGTNTFRNCASIAQTDPTDDSRVAMTGFRIELDDGTSLPGSTTTNVNLGIPVGDEHWGHARVSAYMNAFAIRNRLSELSYDGTTLTDTEKIMAGLGVVVANGFVNNSGALAFQFNNTAAPALTIRQLVVDFDGLWVSAS